MSNLFSSCIFCLTLAKILIGQFGEFSEFHQIKVHLYYNNILNFWISLSSVHDFYKYA